MEYDKFLPIGTVVMLNGVKKGIMITGFCMSSSKEPENIYDYSACLYPEGILSQKQIILFNHEQIEEVLHLGLIGDEEKKFKEELNKVLEDKKNEKE